MHPCVQISKQFDTLCRNYGNIVFFVACVCALTRGCACVSCVVVTAADPSLSHTTSVRWSVAARSLNVMSTDCEIAIKNVINKWSRKHFSKCLRKRTRTERGTRS